MKLSDLKVNSARAEQGAWVGDIRDMPGVRFKARGFNNKDDKKVQEKELEKIPKRRRLRGNVSDEEQRVILNARIKAGLIIDWDGIVGDDDQPIPFSAETLEMFLVDPDYGKLRDAMVFACGIVAEDEDEAKGNDAKN